MSTSPVTAAVASLVTIAGPDDRSRAEDRETPHVRTLLAAALSGDHDAFGELVTLHQRLVFRTALAALGATEDAEDVAQEAFVLAWQKLPGFRGEATFRTWLLTIVWRKALDKRRRRRAWWSFTHAAGPHGTTDWLEQVAGEEPTPERLALSREAADRIRAEILRLTPKLRDTLLLTTSGEHSYDEVATLLGVPLGTVKWRVSEARRLVRKHLNGALDV
jgi:RNA polymerase sigma-70 factor, ECF subfamily